MLSVFLIIPDYALALEAFNISSYDVKMDVRLDRSYKITETIKVDFDEQRRGIIRSIPLKSNSGDLVKISDVTVQNHKYEVYDEGGYKKIKIGDADTYAQQNETYTITYLYSQGKDKLSNMDEFYFNIIGPQWDCNIENVKFEISMPKEFDDSKLNFTYGKTGNKDNSDVEYSIYGNVVSGKLNRALGSYEALTIAIPLEEGYFSEAKLQQNFADLMSKYYMIILPIIALLMALLWTKKGKSNRIIPSVEFYPPEGLTSADVGFMIDNEVQPMDITSLIIYWADKGYLTIEEQEEKKVFGTSKYFILSKVKELDENSKAYEAVVFNALFDEFGNGETVSTKQLEENFYTVMNTAKEMVNSYWQDSSKNRIYKSYNKIMAFFMKFTALLVVWMGFLPLANHMKLGEFVLVALVSFALGFVEVLPIGFMAHTLANWKLLNAKSRFGRVALSILGIAITNLVAFYIAYLTDTIPVLIVTVVCASLILYMSSKCDKKTQLGDHYYGKLIGFREFLQTAEKTRINMLVEENPQYFYSTLPFAMVLGVTDKWAKRFESITMEPPSWYYGTSYNGSFNTFMFANALSHSMHGVNTAMSSSPPPQSTTSAGGSIGGGFSGGGSGGGGGSSW